MSSDIAITEMMSADEAFRRLDGDAYFAELFRLQHELVKLQEWVQHSGLKVVVLFEGRDSAGKGGVVRSGTIVLKYWFSITDEEQAARFELRINDPLKQWKLSPMDIESRRRWEAYTKAKEAMLEQTHIPEEPWWIVEADDKRRARLNCIAHLLGRIPYEQVPRLSPDLPARVRHEDYERQPLASDMYVPDRY